MPDPAVFPAARRGHTLSSEFPLLQFAVRAIDRVANHSDLASGPSKAQLGHAQICTMIELYVDVVNEDHRRLGVEKVAGILAPVPVDNGNN